MMILEGMFVGWNDVKFAKNTSEQSWNDSRSFFCSWQWTEKEKLRYCSQLVQNFQENRTKPGLKMVESSLQNKRDIITLPRYSRCHLSNKFTDVTLVHRSVNFAIADEFRPSLSPSCPSFSFSGRKEFSEPSSFSPSWDWAHCRGRPPGWCRTRPQRMFGCRPRLSHKLCVHLKWKIDEQTV